MKTIFCKNCGSLLEDSNKGRFCSKSCKRKYLKKKIFFWSGVTVGSGLAGYVAWKFANTMYDELYTGENRKGIPCSQTIPAIPEIQEKENIANFKNEIETEVISTEYKEVDIDPFLRKLPENYHPSPIAIRNAHENGIELDPEGNTTFVREQKRNYLVS